MPALYYLTTDELRLQEALDQSGGELTPELETWFEQHKADLGAKLDAYVGLIRTFEMQAVQAKAEKEQWVAKERAAANSAERLKAALTAHLEATRQDKVTTATGRVIALQRSGGVAPISYVEQDKPSDYVGGPFDRFVDTVYVWDKDAVRESLEAGTAVPFAKLGERSLTLRIR